jgi:hypothetical protein
VEEKLKKSLFSVTVTIEDGAPATSKKTGVASALPVQVNSPTKDRVEIIFFISFSIHYLNCRLFILMEGNTA